MSSRQSSRVLFVTHVVPWAPKYGGAIRCLGMIRSLARLCELHVAFVGSDAAALGAFERVDGDLEVTLHVIPPDPGWENVPDWQSSRSLRTLLGQGKYHDGFQELLQSLQPNLAWFFEVWSLRRVGFPRGTPVVLDFVDVRWRKQVRVTKISPRLESLSNLAKAALLRLDDIQLALRSTNSVVASPEEVALLSPARSVTCIPNGFDFAQQLEVRAVNSNMLVFYGSLFYEPNVDGIRWMCKEVWPRLRGLAPDAQLHIIGAAHEVLADLFDTDGVVFHGFVDDLDSIITRAAALVVPLRVAGGTRIKILEAWSKGIPVVSTSVGAEGLGAIDGINVVLADTPEAFAQACVRIMAAPEFGSRLADNAHKYGSSTFDWAVIQNQLRKILVEINVQ